MASLLYYERLYS